MNKKCFVPADILLPKKDFEKWAVIACDQYTSEPEYWQNAERLIGDSPSALHLILPEVYLSEDDSEKIEKINATMQKYINEQVLEEYPDSMIYIERTCSDGRVRRGIVGGVDLSQYDYHKGTDAAVRATEETVESRIPPRVEIRKDAILELPHVMLLVDDPDCTVTEPLSDMTDDLEKLYDFTLMQNAGSIKGWRIKGELVGRIQNALEKVAARNNGLMFCVGDGNHSLATAKTCYELDPTCKSGYALAEVVNIHDESLDFEPIYRVVFGVNPQDLIEDFVKYTGGSYNGEDAQRFTCVFGNTTREISVRPTAKLAVGTLQTFLDGYLKSIDGASIDYIHGEESLKKLSEAENAVGFLFEGMRKDELFPAVLADGSLPRKTFSMGHADDKRFYIEARKIK